MLEMLLLLFKFIKYLIILTDSNISSNLSTKRLKISLLLVNGILKYTEEYKLFVKLIFLKSNCIPEALDIIPVRLCFKQYL
jgi:hypothetical protein